MPLFSMRASTTLYSDQTCPPHFSSLNPLSLSLTFTLLSTQLLQAPPFFLTHRFYLRVQQNALNSFCKGRCINNFMIFRDGNIESSKKGGKNDFFRLRGCLHRCFQRLPLQSLSVYRSRSLVPWSRLPVMV
jgi:hypothetical protein